MFPLVRAKQIGYIQQRMEGRQVSTISILYSVDSFEMAQELPLIQLLLEQVETLYRGNAWHGPALRGCLRDLSASEAEEHRAASGHSLADIALHCAYWKYAVRRRLIGGKRGSFPWKGSNWFTLPAPLTEEVWKSILRTLDDEHDALCDAVMNFPPFELFKKQKGSKFLPYEMIQGIAAHDVYHAGQVRVMKPKR
jgi:uncharacterized damage-inducible protein DinB